MKKPLIVAAVCGAILSMSGTAYSLRLGSPQLNSELHKPLNLQIPVQTMAADELSISLHQSGIFTTPAVNHLFEDISYSVSHHGYDGHFIDIKTSQPVTESALQMFVSAESATGASDIREYSIELPDTSADGSTIDDEIQVLRGDQEVGITEIGREILIGSLATEMLVRLYGVVVEVPDSVDSHHSSDALHGHSTKYSAGVVVDIPSSSGEAPEFQLPADDLTSSPNTNSTIKLMVAMLDQAPQLLTIKR